MKKSKIYEEWKKIEDTFLKINEGNKKLDAINKMLMRESIVRKYIKRDTKISNKLSKKSLLIGKGVVKKNEKYSGDCDLLIYNKNDVKNRRYALNGNIILDRPKNNFIMLAIEARISSKIGKCIKNQKKFGKKCPMVGVYFRGYKPNHKSRGFIEFNIQTESGWMDFRNYFLKLIKEL